MTSSSPRLLAAVPPAEPPVFLLAIEPARGRLSVRGELDRAHVHRLTDALDVLHRSPVGRWELDAAGITFCDAAGLRGLLQAGRTALGAGRSLVVARPRPMLVRLLTLAGPAGLDLLDADRPA